MENIRADYFKRRPSPVTVHNCSECTKKFANKNTLFSHMLSHISTIDPPSVVSVLEINDETITEVLEINDNVMEDKDVGYNDYMDLKIKSEAPENDTSLVPLPLVSESTNEILSPLPSAAIDLEHIFDFYSPSRPTQEHNIAVDVPDSDHQLPQTSLEADFQNGLLDSSTASKSSWSGINMDLNLQEIIPIPSPLSSPCKPGLLMPKYSPGELLESSPSPPRVCKSNKEAPTIFSPFEPITPESGAEPLTIDSITTGAAPSTIVSPFESRTAGVTSVKIDSPVKISHVQYTSPDKSNRIFPANHSTSSSSPASSNNSTNILPSLQTYPIPGLEYSKFLVWYSSGLDVDQSCNFETEDNVNGIISQIEDEMEELKHNLDLQKVEMGDSDDVNNLNPKTAVVGLDKSTSPNTSKVEADESAIVPVEMEKTTTSQVKISLNLPAVLDKSNTLPVCQEKVSHTIKGNKEIIAELKNFRQEMKNDLKSRNNNDYYSLYNRIIDWQSNISDDSLEDSKHAESSDSSYSIMGDSENSSSSDSNHEKSVKTSKNYHSFNKRSKSLLAEGSSKKSEIEIPTKNVEVVTRGHTKESNIDCQSSSSNDRSDLSDSNCDDMENTSSKNHRQNPDTKELKGAKFTNILQNEPANNISVEKNLSPMFPIVSPEKLGHSNRQLIKHVSKRQKTGNDGLTKIIENYSENGGDFFDDRVNQDNKSVREASQDKTGDAYDIPCLNLERGWILK